MGELNPVMNGVEFRTRHNDYKLRMPSRSSGDYHAYENVPFPDVPPSVKSKRAVQDQIVEMREYFRAFKDQNITHRDYRPYFKPVLCYLEGAWTLSSKTLDEPFQSDHHFIDADSWFDLMDKVRFTSYTGSKSVLENYAFLPTTIYNVSDGIPQYAQWNYRIMCHPLNNDLPTKMFIKEDDLMYRFPQRKTMDQITDTRAERFHLNERDVDHYSNGKGILDDLMLQVPGKDNYQADLHDHSFDMEMENVRFNNHTLINTGYYHRYFKTLDKGAMGIKAIHRGFSDANLFVAQTTQARVAPMSTSKCGRENGRRVCHYWTTRYSYALPIEIIYMTVNEITVLCCKYSYALHMEIIYMSALLYYRTPVEFYSSGKVDKDPADTAKTGAGVLDKTGQVRMMSSSGVRIRTPSIEGVGVVRTRYPIMPVHGEGAPVWKELNALKDMTMHMNRYASLFEERPGQMSGNGTGDAPEGILHYQVTLTKHRVVLLFFATLIIALKYTLSTLETIVEDQEWSLEPFLGKWHQWHFALALCDASLA
ncbi:hypothetical protein PoB_007635000 [Plakobranchus ocellatus]|uniref:Uncharacterized protein n=1 Tax=Plakobranchus ocellatus TaxID=259542 RepID=A0AAV4E0H7_9GAST|nr:hypothetical protein PoB_007635000 [Plakobranchus ocellatus]